MNPGVASLIVIFAATLAPTPEQPPVPAPLSFKEVATQGGAIVLARCITDGRRITCLPLEAWRETAPERSVRISLENWGRFPVEIHEVRPEGKFLLLLQPKRDVGCVVVQRRSGGTLRRLGNVDTCVVPIVDGRLPEEFRRFYDNTRGPAMTIAQLKADLLNSSKAPFLDRARNADCTDVRNRLFVIDGKLVFWDRAGSCPDNSYGSALYGATVDDVLCYHNDSIAGPMKGCPFPEYEEMFETITGHGDDPDLGLGPGHAVEELPL